MTDQTIQYTEKMVGANHPALADTLNRLALVEHNNDGTHKSMTQVKDPYVDVRAYGAVGDGTTDDSTAIQNAINAVSNSGSIPSGGVVFLPSKTFNLGTTGITLPEGVRLIGSGRRALVSGVIVGGTWLKYTGTGNAITIDGEASTATYRRDMHIKNLGIFVQSGVNAAISADFMTNFEMDDIFIYGAATYGLYMTNSYNGTIKRLKAQSCGTGMYMTIKVSPNDIFSGQLLVEACDFWDSTAKGLHIVANVNVLAEMVFLKTHFKTNAYGAYIEGANIHRVNFRGCHFEGNTTNDIYVHSDVTQGPIVDGCHINNNDAVYKINIQGDKASITNNEFTGGATGYGVKINGDDCYIARNHFQGIAGSQILIDTSANYATIGKNTQSVTSNRVVDISTTQTTIFDGEEILESKEFDLSGAADIEVKFYALRDYYIRDARIIYVEATSADAGVALQFGDSASATRYMNHTSDISQAAYDIATPTLASAYIARDRRLKITCAGGKTGTGTAKIVARLVPFATS